ncbi:MAG: hypothetical protein JSR17_03240 [Proteobacteria bacterium]|nr:hypothetical protein [Pseudomonadota bacterium]
MAHQGPLENVEATNAGYPLHIRRYASGQYQSYLAYYLSTLKELPSRALILTAEGSFKAYHLKAFKLKKGMYAYLLLPEDKDSGDVKVIFRGTDFSESKSIAINVETWGPGYASFEAEKENIFSTFNHEIYQHYGKEPPALNLEVSGHSQGAAFSQLFVTEFLKRRSTSTQYDFIQALTMNAYNSPGVPHTTAKEAYEAVVNQFMHGKKLNIVANYGMVGGDAVQVTGHNMILVGLGYYLAELNLLKVDANMEGNWVKGFNFDDGLQPIEIWDCFKKAYAAMLGAHTTGNFFAPLEENGKISVTLPYQFYTNKNKKDIPIIEKELLNKALYLQYAFILAKIPLHYFLDHKDDHSFFSWMTTIRGVLGNSLTETLYQKLSGWLSSTPEAISMAAVPARTLLLSDTKVVNTAPSVSDSKATLTDKLTIK